MAPTKNRSPQREPLRTLSRHRSVQIAVESDSDGRWTWRPISTRRRLPVLALNLERFYLGQRVPVSDTILAEVSKLDTLLWLKLSDLMTDEARQEGLQRLGALTRLEHLELGDPNSSPNDNVHMNDSSMLFLRSMGSLESLILCACSNLSDAGLAPLAQLTRLRHLSLHRCSGLAGGCLEQLRHMPSLRHLDLRSCIQLKASSLKHLRDRQSITRLDLRGCRQLGDRRALGLIGTLRGLQRLDLSDCPKLTDGGLELLAPLARLERLELANGHRLTNRGLAHVSCLRGLTHLDLSGCTKITDAGLVHLGKLERLVYLDLSQCESITDAGLEHLRSLTALRTLHLHCAKVTGKGLTRLQRALPGVSVGWSSADDYWDAYGRAIGCA